MILVPAHVEKAAALAEKEAAAAFARFDATALAMTARVLEAFHELGLSERHLKGTTGYGYGDDGRDLIDAAYARVFGCEDALVRHFMISGTHAISVAMYALLRPGDRMLSVTGPPYDTLHDTIGISRHSGRGSLKDFGVGYAQLELTESGGIDYAALGRELKAPTRLIFVQRSRGYSVREPISVDEVARLCEFVRAASPDTLILVDNCYGEFVEPREPVAVGAHIMAGSLIKNPGGGMAETGGYIAGRADLVELCAYRLTAPGLGKDVGASVGQNMNILRGLFLAPHVVAQALKTAAFAAALFSALGYGVAPGPLDPRSDIIQRIDLKTPEKLRAFCEGIQLGAPVDALVKPVPWDMPGYDDQIIMAAGAFVSGASIELSADGPMRDPYPAYMQGGLTYESGKLGVMQAAAFVDGGTGA